MVVADTQDTSFEAHEAQTACLFQMFALEHLLLLDGLRRRVDRVAGS